MLQDVVNWQMAKRRSGTAQAKLVAEVAATKAKPWRQKGTGRARHGSLVGPQFRGGAVIFGPRQRDFSYSLNKKLRRGALKMALSLKINLGFFSLSRGAVVERPKTKDLVTKVGNYIGKKSLLYCVPQLSEALVLAGRNVPGILVVTADGLNVRDILRSDVIVIDKDAVNDVLRRIT